MPLKQILEKLYSVDYLHATSTESLDSNEQSAPNQRFSGTTNALKEYLEAVTSTACNNSRKFLDFGCGSYPPTLEIASEAGFEAFGYELDSAVSAEAKRLTGKEIFSGNELKDSKLRFDCIFVGDVLEHLVDPVETLKNLRNLLTKDGSVVAQGPLEGAQTITHTLVGIRAWLFPEKKSEIAPYHVSLATTDAMVALFQKSGFVVRDLTVHEILWPAISIREAMNTKSVRNTLLAICKSADRLLAVFFKNYGNRYFLVATNS